jgi:hypothetical protein
MPSNEFTELLVMQHTVSMIAEFDVKVLPPTIVTARAPTLGGNRRGRFGQDHRAIDSVADLELPQSN